MQVLKKSNADPTGIAAFYWAIILSIFLLFYILMATMSWVVERRGSDFSNDLTLLTPIEAHKNDADITAVVLGNSRLRYAFTHGLDPGKPVVMPDGRRFWVAQYAKDVALFSDYLQIWPHILKARPDYIVIQDLVLTTARSVDRATYSPANISANIYSFLEQTILRRSHQEHWLRDRYDLGDYCETVFDRAAMQDRLVFAAYRDRHAIEGNDNLVKVREALAEAQARGIKIIVLQLPPNTERIAPFAVPLHVIDRYGLGYHPAREQLLPDLHDKVVWLDYPPQPADRYCDYVHLNRGGREIFSRWLLEMLCSSGYGNHS